MPDTYLADTSALARLRHLGATTVLAPLIESGVVATCGVIEFELGWATRSSEEFDQCELTATLAMNGWPPMIRTGGALDVQAALWHGRRIRAVGLPGLLIAAVAEREHVTICTTTVTTN